ncbi:MAG: WD40 repeat domain-containing protein [Planctomycetota bacterium]
MEVGKEVVPGMRLRCICRGHKGTIGRIAWSPCGRFIASPSTDKTIRIWDANDGQCLAVLEGDYNLRCVTWSPDGELLAAGGAGPKVLLWQIPDPNKCQKPAEEIRYVEGSASSGVVSI